MVIVPPLAIEKLRNGAMANAGKTLFALFTKVWNIHRGFLDDDKKIIPLLAVDTEYFQRAFANPCSV
jgi:hypothetical protein